MPPFTPEHGRASVARVSEPHLSREELRDLALASLGPEIELFGGSSETGRVLHLDGVLASVVPATPDRSIFNSVVAATPQQLAAAIDELQATYERSGVRAWTVWITDEDAASQDLLVARGHVLDGTPRAMALDLADLREPAPGLPAKYEPGVGAIADVAALNDRAYGLTEKAWRAAVTRPSEADVRWVTAMHEGKPVACSAGITAGEDMPITGVATLPDHRGMGLASALMHRLLSDARERGARTGSLQASKLGAPVYERLGFRDVGHFEMWERRQPA